MAIFSFECRLRVGDVEVGVESFECRLLDGVRGDEGDTGSMNRVTSIDFSLLFVDESKKSAPTSNDCFLDMIPLTLFGNGSFGDSGIWSCFWMLDVIRSKSSLEPHIRLFRIES